ncbi:ABC transporter permease [Pontibacillus litoralis]|uniref:Sulfonate ABC transporter permease n=1 Tax=Pontibacillus litoralis JSM 072002 TaxID=1385512 RepID=A0A0A5G6M9_9BACI|nr:ABC transporter permease [Pontibacillus litoralis]KGX86755.1 sulfonate ABC transporter permease [Pontibacillus litoralis JSM 072002]
MNHQQTDNQRFEQYKKQAKKEKRSILMWQVIIFIAFFSIWEIISRLHWIDPLIFSSPTNIVQLLVDKMVDQTIFIHLQVTVLETIIGFLLGTILGILLASLLWWSPKLSRISDPYLVILNAMPKVALGPIIIVALGPGYASIIAMGAFISIIITTIVVYTAFQNVDENYLKVLASFGASRYQSFKEAVLPASFTTIISTFKVNVGLSWVGVIVGEFLVSQKGLGYLIIYGFQVFDFTLVLASLLLIAICAAIMYQLVERLERRLMN